MHGGRLIEPFGEVIRERDRTNPFGTSILTAFASHGMVESDELCAFAISLYPSLSFHGCT